MNGKDSCLFSFDSYLLSTSWHILIEKKLSMKSINLFSGYPSSDLTVDFLILIESIKFILLHFLDQMAGYETI